MRKAFLGLWSLIVLAIVVGGIVRLSLAHADASSLVNYVTTVVAVAIPSAASYRQSKKSAGHAEDAVTVATDAADSARKAEANTNGKMDVRFAELRKAIQDNGAVLTRHLEYHAEKDGA